MIIIGEKLNSSIPRMREAMENNDEAFVIEMAKKQVEAGANYLDVNAGVFTGVEEEKLTWLVTVAQQATGSKLMIDSPSPKAIEAGLKADKVGNAIVNSVTLEEGRLYGILPLVKEYDTGIVALPIDTVGIPKTAEKRVELADKLIDILRNEGIADDKIYIDALLEAVATDSEAAKVTLDTLKTLRAKYPHIHLTCGLSNVSFGLPNRGVINATFLTAAMLCGLDSAIMDIVNPTLKQALVTTEVILGRDDYCLEYISYFRSL